MSTGPGSTDRASSSELRSGAPADLAFDLLFQGVEEAAPPPGALGRELVPVEERTLLGEDQAGANGQDVRLWGGAQAIQQYMAAGRLDVLELHVVPVLLGDGERLFDNLGDAEPRLEQVRAVEAPGVTHLKYGVRPGS